MNIIKKFRKISAQNCNDILKAEKKKGKKIIGYFCSYVPEEVIHAAGFIPYRMRAVGSTGTGKGDVYYSSLNCTFVRHVFDKVMRGEFGFLDGVIFMNGCDHTRRMYDNWRYADIAPDFLYMFVTPHVIDEAAEDRFRDEIQGLIDAVKKHFGVKITKTSLKKSIKLYNRKRQLLSEIYAMRKRDNPPIKGSEFLSVLLSVTSLPVENSIKLLEALTKEIKNRKVAKKDDLRIFLSSGCVEEVEHIELIEKSGAVIVADNLCLGAKHFDMLVDKNPDPVHALAKRYLHHLSCPRMMNDFWRRLEYLREMKEEYAVDAFVVEKLKFCDLWGGEMYLYRQDAKKYGYPILALERELYGGGDGQIRTRVQAFFEQVRSKRPVENDLVRTSGDNYWA